MGTLSKFDEKLAEARYFLSRMRAEVANPDPLPLTANLRAFVGAARSAVLYAEEDVFQKANGRPAKGAGERRSHPKVQRLQMLHTTEQVLTFFRELRNEDVHIKPSGSLGKAPHTLTVRAFGAGECSERVSVTVYTATLIEWPHPGPDLFTLCEQYLDQIEEFLRRAATEGLIRR